MSACWCSACAQQSSYCFCSSQVPDPDGAMRIYNHNCKRCPLHKDAHTVCMPATNGRMRAMIVGEAPGRNEDDAGTPFIGQAGQTLIGAIKGAGFTRSDVYITNMVKCRPPGNRNPTTEEIEACDLYLEREIKQHQIKHILALGNIAGSALCPVPLGITAYRGEWYYSFGTAVIATFHPAYVNRKGVNSEEARLFRQDVKTFLREANDAGD